MLSVRVKIMMIMIRKINKFARVLSFRKVPPCSLSFCKLALASLNCCKNLSLVLNTNAESLNFQAQVKMQSLN